MIKPKMLGAMQSLANSSQGSMDFFSSRYSLKAKAGGADGLIVGQEIYCLPLIRDGIYEIFCHRVKARTKGVDGFKAKFDVYVPCHGHNVETGEFTSNCTCCQLFAEENEKHVAAGKTPETEPIISYRTSRILIPVLILGNNTGSKTALHVTMQNLTMSGRDFSYLDLSRKGFKEFIEIFKNDLINNGRMEYGLEDDAMFAELMTQLQKHIIKISINKPETVGTHKKHFSFISYANTSIGANTGSYKNITEGLTASKKLQSEVDEFLTLFQNECENIFTEWTDQELIDYVHNTGASTSAAFERQVQTSGVVPTVAKASIPKAEQIVIEEDIKVDSTVSDVDSEESFFDGEEATDITLDEVPFPTSAPEPVAVGASPVQLTDDDMSFEMGEEDFFND